MIFNQLIHHTYKIWICKLGAIGLFTIGKGSKSRKHRYMHGRTFSTSKIAQ